MVRMADKKKRKPGRTPNKGRTRDNQGGFRAFDSRLLTVLDAYAATLDRSRNYVINQMIEEALRKLGLWPPPDETLPPEGQS